MKDTPTMDLAGFGYMELDKARAILSVLQEKGSPDFLTDGLKIMFNQNSGCVFLTDNDYNVAVLDDSCEELVQFFSCPECGYENTQEDALEEPADGNGETKDFIKWEGYCSSNCYNKNQ